MADTLQSLAILGATGSIGDSTLAIIRQHPNWHWRWNFTLSRFAPRLIIMHN